MPNTRTHACGTGWFFILVENFYSKISALCLRLGLDWLIVSAHPSGRFFFSLHNLIHIEMLINSPFDHARLKSVLVIFNGMP